VWEMQYGGSYPERVIPFLRQALLLNYSKNSWYGGRGPKKYSDGKFRYFNDIVDGNEFAWFDGIETIEEYDGVTWQRVGAHYYRGGFLY
jgi:hypothetical protein